MTSTTINSSLLETLSEAFANEHLAPAVMLVISAIALTRAQVPRFDYRSVQFKRVRFERTWKNVLWESNGAFGLRLENAALLAMAGQRSDLKAMVADESMLETVMQICFTGKPSDNSEDDETGSEDSSDAAPKTSLLG
mmetsp:Transcript_1576/g.1871  ORF Transcript_1576/g.1871 Transcript_1576/m.1871 type:complete len:138 (+) Transcript_1576:93-506(+)